MLDLSQFTVLTFDCYGTLVDWESGILSVLRPLLKERNAEATDDEILTLYSDFESAAEQPPYRSYRNVLENVIRGFGVRFGFEPTSEELASLAESLPSWQPFTDTLDSLRRLKKRFRLGIITNTDEDLFAQTARVLQVPFDYVVTAQSAGSYKPDFNNFEIALRRIGESKEHVLHVAESLYHDIAPANSLGLRSVWVKRQLPGRSARASRTAQARPDLTVDGLRALADIASG